MFRQKRLWHLSISLRPHSNASLLFDPVQKRAGPRVASRIARRTALVRHKRHNANLRPNAAVVNDQRPTGIAVARTLLAHRRPANRAHRRWLHHSRAVNARTLTVGNDPFVGPSHVR